MLASSARDWYIPRMRYFFALATVLALLWLGMSGVYKPVVLLLGVASVALVVWLTERMEVLGAEHDPGTLSWRLPIYWGWLVWQIILANVMVARAVINPKLMKPSMMRVPADTRSRVGLVTFGNSITLTPGTVTTELSDGSGDIEVHALLEEAAKDLGEGEMLKKVQWLEGDHP